MSSSDEISAQLKRIASLTTRYIELTPRDIAALHAVAPKILERSHEIASRVTESLLRDEDAKKIVEGTGLTVERANALFEKWLRQTFTGSYGLTHALEIFRIGLAHVRAGVDERLMTCNMGAFAREIARVLSEEGLAEAIPAAAKALFWNLTVMLYSYEYVKRLVVEEATGMKGELVKRLVRLYSQKVYERITGELAG